MPGETPAVQLSYSMGNFLTGFCFLGPFYSERFRSIAKIGGATAQSYRNLLRVVSSLQFLISPARLFGFCTGSSSALATASNEA